MGLQNFGIIFQNKVNHTFDDSALEFLELSRS